MGLEKRRGKPYYYSKKRRQGGKVTSVYEASGELAQMVAVLVADAQATQQAQREALRQEQTRHTEQDRELMRLEELLNDFFTYVAQENGYHKPKRTWRKRRTSKKSAKPNSNVSTP